MYEGQSISVSLDNKGIAYLVLNTHNASVNVFTPELQEELRLALQALKASKSIKGLLIYSAKKTFVLGADINTFPRRFSESATKIAAWAGDFHAIFSGIESLPFPTVTALNGIAVGGGMELALATDFRIADADAQLGLPEVKLGICPGWGGTVRLSRLIGLEPALAWMLSGRMNRAADALAEQAIDAVVELPQLLAKGREILTQAIDGGLDYTSRRQAKQAIVPIDDSNHADISTLKQRFAAWCDPHYPAAEAILETTANNMSQHFPLALNAEVELFGELASSDTAKNLVAVFLNAQQIKKKTSGLIKAAQPFKQAAVIGAGIMGGGIACQSAVSDIPITMKDINQEALSLGMDTVEQVLNRSVKKGKLTPQQKTAVIERINPVLDYQDFDKVDIAIEAVVEQASVKHGVLDEVQKHTGENTIIASNTSTISINQLAKDLARPENFCGMHFFNPVHAMELVEVIRGESSSEQTIATTVAYAALMGKVPIVVNDCPGFFVNRVLFPYFNGFNRLLSDGVDFERIDKVMEAFGWPMGPAYLADVIGLDTMVHADKVMQAGFPERMGHDNTPVIEQLFDLGALGQKNHQGFYTYAKDQHGRRIKSRSPMADAIIQQTAVETITMSDEDIVARMMLPMCLEVVRCVNEGVVGSVAEADMGVILGLGFPRFRGGILKYIDTIGLQPFAALAERHASLGPLYQLPREQQRQILENRPFYANTLMSN